MYGQLLLAVGYVHIHTVPKQYLHTGYEVRPTHEGTGKEGVQRGGQVNTVQRGGQVNTVQ